MDDKDAWYAAELINGCEFIKIKSGHSVHLDKPEKFTEILNSFSAKLK